MSVIVGAQLRWAMPRYGHQLPVACHYTGSRFSWSAPEQCSLISTSMFPIGHGATGAILWRSIPEILSHFSLLSHESALSALQELARLSAPSWTLSATRYPFRAFRYAF